MNLGVLPSARAVGEIVLRNLWAASPAFVFARDKFVNARRGAVHFFAGLARRARIRASSAIFGSNAAALIYASLAVARESTGHRFLRA